MRDDEWLAGQPAEFRRDLVAHEAPQLLDSLPVFVQGADFGIAGAEAKVGEVDANTPMPRGIAQTARIREQRRRDRREQVEDVGLIVHDQQRRPLRPDRRVVCERALRRRNCPRFIYPVVRIGLPDFSGWRHGMCAFKKDDSIYHGASRTSTSLAVSDVR
ncbi:hypothetical protein G6F68_015181 [Rhizopus microsporus]|nr:hypothetical protein G6F68_015181 [Rhizopus microsporus]